MNETNKEDNTPKIFKQDVGGGKVGLSSGFEAVQKSKDQTKAVRSSNANTSYSADYDSEHGKEKIETAEKYNKKAREQAAARRILSKYNTLHNTQYLFDPNIQPVVDDIADAYFVDNKSKITVLIQVRISDDQPWKDVNTKGVYERAGEAYEISNSSIKKAIRDKVDKNYDKATQQQTVLVLDGWPFVTKDHLDRFKKEERLLMANSLFKEIWFAGVRDETIDRLFPL